MAKFFLARVAALFLLLVLDWIGGLVHRHDVIAAAAVGLAIVAIANFFAKRNTFSSLIPAVQCFSFSGGTFASGTEQCARYWNLAHVGALIAIVLSVVLIAINRPTPKPGPRRALKERT